MLRPGDPSPDSGRGERPVRRYAFAYAVSILLHCLLVLFFGIDLLVPGSVAGVSSSESEPLRVSSEQGRPVAEVTAAPAPTVAPLPSVAPPPVAQPRTPQPRRVPPPAQPRIARSAPHRHELSKQAPTAPPQQARIVALAPVVKASAVPSPQPTAPPTVPPATSAPRPVPTVAATIAPTSPPTVAPTLAPTAAPTVRPTVAPPPPTAAPTIAPTRPPTAAPTRAPTAAPTHAPTAAPTERPATPVPATPRPAPPATPRPAPPATSRPAPPASAPPRAAATAPAAGATAAPSPGGGRAPAGAKGPGGGGSSPGPAGQGQGGQASPAPAAPNGGGGAKTAFVPHPAGTPVSGSDLDKLNARLGSLLSGGAVSEYSHGSRTGTLEVETIPAEFLKKVSPPPEILRKTIALNYRKRSASQADSVLYVTGRKRILVEVCTGWMVELHPLGGGPPQGYLYLGPCPTDDVVPSWAGALPTPPPHRASP